MALNARARCAWSLAALSFLGGCTGAPDKPASMERLAECGWLPNCVNTQSGRGIQSSEPLAANTGQWQELKSWIAQQEDWEITIAGDNFVQAVVKTPVMRFRDDVQLLFFPEAQLIQVRSSSRLGISDLGTNARRVETLRDQLAP